MHILDYLTAKPTIRYCEDNLSSWIAQPANAVSSLFISLAGGVIFVRNRGPFSKTLGSIAVITGIASFLYYVTNTFASQLADLGSMFLLASFLLVSALRNNSFEKEFQTIFIAALSAVSLALTAVFKTIGGFNIGIPIFALIVLAAIYFEQRNVDIDSRRYYWLSLLTLAIGFLFWVLDYKQIWCDPATAHFINGHAVWHSFNALALLLLDMYYPRLFIPRLTQISK